MHIEFLSYLSEEALAIRREYLMSGGLGLPTFLDCVTHGRRQEFLDVRAGHSGLFDTLAIAVHGCLESLGYHGDLALHLSDPRKDSFSEADLIEAIDGLCDLRVVVTGTLVSLGYSDRSILSIGNSPSRHQRMVTEVMLRCKQDVSTDQKIILLTPEDFRMANLRLRLILEEYREFMEAFGLTVVCNMEPHIEGTSSIIMDQAHLHNSFLGALSIILSFWSAIGLPDNPFQQEVDYNNLTKVNPLTGLMEKDSGGKFTKPAGYQPPRIRAIYESYVVARSCQ